MRVSEGVYLREIDRCPLSNSSSSFVSAEEIVQWDEQGARAEEIAWWDASPTSERLIR